MSVADALVEWRDFYAAVAEAGGSLLGLVFVGITIHLGRHPLDLRTRALGLGAILALLHPPLASLVMLLPVAPVVQGPAASGHGGVRSGGDGQDRLVQEISLDGDGASYRLDFGGRLERSTQVTISARASSVELIVPSSTPARITAASLLGDLDVGDGLSRQNGEVCTTAAAATDRPLLTIHASVEVGQLRLRRATEGVLDHGQP